MILADTSVWIDYLNGRITPQTDLLDDSLMAGALAMGDLIFLEVLQGVRDDKQFELVKKKLSILDQYTMFNSKHVIEYANNYRSLRKKGITIRKTNDVIIASFCIQENMPLLFVDRDFKPFIEYLGLIPAYLET
ncbi:type II toxin-antitoxin system VapC family toxin [Glaciecola petra]|uniref:PIN domain nuclease n=1 Tax=Glaciecola petra TaxID=3075602 RepID=A0ABU2ZP72_9ALTE|nr:PIN domain nuclease [Aestuariibacter sp. P117]MDT0594417.1 PIN domain nuclease [Aestuariibacter sp. P117]